MNKCEQIIAISGSGAVLTCDKTPTVTNVYQSGQSLCTEHQHQYEDTIHERMSAD